MRFVFASIFCFALIPQAYGAGFCTQALLEARVFAELKFGHVLQRQALQGMSVFKLTFDHDVQAVYKLRATTPHPAEVLAYELDKALGHPFHIPMTVERHDTELN